MAHVVTTVAECDRVGRPLKFYLLGPEAGCCHFSDRRKSAPRTSAGGRMPTPVIRKGHACQSQAVVFGPLLQSRLRAGGVGSAPRTVPAIVCFVIASLRRAHRPARPAVRERSTGSVPQPFLAVIDAVDLAVRMPPYHRRDAASWAVFAGISMEEHFLLVASINASEATTTQKSDVRKQLLDHPNQIFHLGKRPITHEFLSP